MRPRDIQPVNPEAERQRIDESETAIADSQGTSGGTSIASAEFAEGTCLNLSSPRRSILEDRKHDLRLRLNGGRDE